MEVGVDGGDGVLVMGLGGGVWKVVVDMGKVDGVVVGEVGLGE